MVAAGRVTSDEAEQIAAADEGERDAAVEAVRLRHMRARVDAEVQAGRLAREEGDAMLERISNGEHPRLLRELRRIRSSPARTAVGTEPSAPTSTG